MKALLGFIKNILSLIISFLPDSPFINIAEYISSSQYLKYIAWVIPIQQIIIVTELWLTAITIFYIYQAVLRWAKAIE